jgi:multiple sugar transport system substrate-binding protein
MRRLRVSRGLALVAALVVACTGVRPTPSTLPPPTAEPVALHFTFWGSDVERAAVEKTVRAFEAANPNIKVQAEHIPGPEYVARLSAMFAAGDPPDVGYLYETHAALWASGGKVLDMTDVVNADPLLADRLPETYYYYGSGKTLGTNTATETTVMFYNKDLFDQAGLPYPPSDPEQAWTWPEFLAAARRLTSEPGCTQASLASTRSRSTSTVCGWPTNGGATTPSFTAMVARSSTRMAPGCCWTRRKRWKPCRPWPT